MSFHWQIAEPRRILDRVLERAPSEADPYRAGENPYFKNNNVLTHEWL